MFTGIIAETGRIVDITHHNKHYVLRVDYCYQDEVQEGESIALDGVCLDARLCDEGGIVFLLSERLFAATNFSEDKIVNIERAIALSTEKQGHFITGKVDQLGIIADIKLEKDIATLVIRNIDDKYLQNLCPRCPIAINGVSLKVHSIMGNTISVKMSSNTAINSNLKLLTINDIVNIEYYLLNKKTENNVIYNLQHVSSVN